MEREETSTTADLLACHDCDALYRLRSLNPGASAHCDRCGAVLYRHRANSLERTLAFALTALVCFTVANVNPVLGLNAGGRIQETTLFSGVTALYQEGMWMLAALVFATSMLFPLLTLLTMIYVLLPLKLGRQGPGATRMFRLLLTALPWSMVGVYMLGVLVAVVKLVDLATVIPGLALYAIAALIVTMVAMESSLDRDTVWRRMSWSP